MYLRTHGGNDGILFSETRSTRKRALQWNIGTRGGRLRGTCRSNVRDPISSYRQTATVLFTTLIGAYPTINRVTHLRPYHSARQCWISLEVNPSCRLVRKKIRDRAPVRDSTRYMVYEPFAWYAVKTRACCIRSYECTRKSAFSRNNLGWLTG